MSNATNLLRSPRDIKILLNDAASDPAALQLLEDSITPFGQARFQAKLMSLIPEHFHSGIDKSNITRCFLSWCEKPELNCPANLKVAACKCRGRKIDFRKEKLDFISKAGLNWAKEQKDKYIADIPVVVVEPLAESYPPLGHWVYESQEIYAKWHEDLCIGKQPDKRIPRRPLLRLDPAMLAGDILTDESAIFREPSGELAGLVIRDFCPDDPALKWSDEAIKEAVDERRSIRVWIYRLGTGCTLTVFSLRIQASWS
jgi:hypothetical protein